MPKLAVVILADTQTRGDLGRVANALETAREFKEAGDEVAIIFDGAGTRWIPELDEEDHRKHELWLAVKDKVAGACSFCATAFGVRKGVEEAGVALLDDFDDHPSLRRYIVDGYHVLTF